MLRPQERLAAILGGRDVALACEELTLRARLDADAGRWREAAFQLRVALEATIAELGPWSGQGDIAERIAELTELREAVGGAANAALEGGLDDERDRRGRRRRSTGSRRRCARARRPSSAADGDSVGVIDSTGTVASTAVSGSAGTVYSAGVVGSAGTACSAGVVGSAATLFSAGVVGSAATLFSTGVVTSVGRRQRHRQHRLCRLRRLHRLRELRRVRGLHRLQRAARRRRRRRQDGLRRGLLRRVEIDADHEVLRAGAPDDPRVRAGAAIERHDPLEPRLRVLVDEVRRPGTPRPAGLHAHSRLGLDVAHVVRALSVLGDDPEDVAVEAVRDRRDARLSALAAGRLDQRGAAAHQPVLDRGAGDAIDQPHLERGDQRLELGDDVAVELHRRRCRRSGVGPCVTIATAPPAARVTPGSCATGWTSSEEPTQSSTSAPCASS